MGRLVSAAPVLFITSLATACAAAPTAPASGNGAPIDPAAATQSPNAMAAAGTTASPGPTTTGFTDLDPSIEVLEQAVNAGTCVRLRKMDAVVSRLPDDEARVTIGSLVASDGRQPGPALTEWLVLAAKYQELCGAPSHADQRAHDYIEQSVPMAERLLEQAVRHGRCTFVAAVDEYGAWPHEVTFSAQLVQRDFSEAEITRKVWRETMLDYTQTCGGMLSRRQQIRVETEVARLDRIIGLDDDQLIALRTKMLDALEHGNERQVVAYAQAIAEREKSLDSQHAAQYDAKLAAIQQQLASANAQVANLSAQAAQAQQSAAAAQTSATDQMAQNSANVAETAANVAKAAAATKTTVSIVRSLF